MAPPTHYLAPASTSSGSQQPRPCGKGIIKSEIAVKEDEPLADVGTWLEALSESRFFTLGSACPLQWLPVLFAVDRAAAVTGTLAALAVTVHQAVAVLAAIAALTALAALAALAATVAIDHSLRL